MPTSSTADFSSSFPVTPDITTLLERMTTAQKVGQLMIIGFDGIAVDAELRRIVTDYHIGGVILFARNVQSPEQIARLTNDLQTIALQSGHPGLYIAIDQEGGRVARLTEDTGFTEFPSAMALTATGDPKNAYRMAAAMAVEMRAVGINVDFAPDLDVNNNPSNPVIGTRSFSSDPDKVAEYGTEFARGLQENGVLAFGKHFPGHGDTSVDSHIDLPLVPHDRARLDEVELFPFRAAIQAEVAGIMSAHVTFPAVDPTPGLAATLSRPVLTGLLRDELSYNGLIVTDSLEMGALAANGYPPPVGAPLAFAAGADLLLFNRDHAMQREAFTNLMQVIQSSKISREQLDASVRRILEAKERFGVLNPTLVADPVRAGESTATAEHHALALELAQKAITLLKDDASLLPLKAGEPVLVIETVAAQGLGAFLGATTLEIKIDPDPRAITDALSAARNSHKVIITTTAASLYPGQVQLVRGLLAQNPNVIIVSVRTPYDISVLPDVPTALVSYGGNRPALQTIANVLMGKAEASGVVPVLLP
ncbi:MAG TPA: beta-N-acetylhexosaminidase [Anaerolineales bacterium]|nr:beta-N-acetylhexosaminidase [Anaerolineales bacterium]